MDNLKEFAIQSLERVQKKGIQKVQLTVASSIAQEMQIEANRMSLLRSTFDQSLSCKGVHSHRQVIKATNQLTPQAVESLGSEAVAELQSGQVDEAYDIASDQGSHSFSSGIMEKNDEWAYEKLSDFLSQIKMLYPEVNMGATLTHVLTKKVLMNSNGTMLESCQGSYHVGSFFSSLRGKKASSFNFTGGSFGLFSEPLLDKVDLRELIRQNIEQIDAQKFSGKFVGDIVIAPHAVGDFLGTALGYLGTGSMLKGTSIYKEKMNQKIASNLLTVSSSPLSEQFCEKAYWTGDGFLAEDIKLIEDGILRSFLLNQYGANKLKSERSKATGSHLILRPGETSLKEMIGGVKKGLLLCRMSAGNPSENGDFSGVAKNSYLIEDGQIRMPVSETMIAGNIAQTLIDISAISKEFVDFGTALMPWVKTSGVTISG